MGNSTKSIEYNETLYNDAITTLAEQIAAMALADADGDDELEPLTLACEYLADANVDVHTKLKEVLG